MFWWDGESRTGHLTRTKPYFYVAEYTHMLLTYQYRIQPDIAQQVQMDLWCELLRRHHNYALGQRLDWLPRTRCLADRCSLISEPIGEIPGAFPNYYLQAGELKQTKALFPDYKHVHHDVQQQNLKRLDKAWERWVKPDNSGRRGGRPRFKKKVRSRIVIVMCTTVTKQPEYF